MSLDDLQRQMQQYLLYEQDAVSDRIRASADFSAKERLDVYREAYYLRLIKVLAADYEVLHRLMGEDAFSAMAHDYLNAFPSQDYTVRLVGKNLPIFLKRCDELPPIYGELAEFEWKLNEAVYKEDKDVLTLQQLAQFPMEDWDHLRFSLHPSVTTMTCHYNMLDLWQSLEADETAFELQTLEQPLHLLIWRKEHEAFFCEMSAEEYQLFTTIQAGHSFIDICNQMLEYFNEAAEEEVVEWVAGVLKSWVLEELFISP